MEEVIPEQIDSSSVFNGGKSKQLEDRVSLINFEKPIVQGRLTMFESPSKVGTCRVFMTETNTENMDSQRELKEPDMEPVSEVKTHFNRDIVLTHSGIMLASFAAFYTIFIPLEMKLYDVQFWFNFGGAIIAFMLLVWNTLFAIILGILAHITSTGCENAFCGIIRYMIPQSLRLFVNNMNH